MNDSTNIRNLILSLDRPVVFHHMINDWDVLAWSLQSWSSFFGDKQLPFRCGVHHCSSQPQWERLCTTELMTMAKFIEFQQISENSENLKWAYFDYKHIHQWAQETLDDSRRLSISWEKFGFPEIESGDSTLWIGSRGAHTPCHMDTYGCNLVAQVYGKKQWILFPPEEYANLRASRVPYEESSIYSQWNFNSPLPPEFFDSVKTVHLVTLNPGDVLFVPRHWWHFVENLTSSVSINTWIPLELDHISRTEEALVRFFMSQITSTFQADVKQYVVNPNEDDIDSNEALTLVKMSHRKLKEVESEASCDNLEHTIPHKRLKLSFPPELANSNINMMDLPRSTLDELKVLQDAKCCCSSLENHHSKTASSSVKDIAKVTNEQSSFIFKIINAFCHPNVISKVREQLSD